MNQLGKPDRRKRKTPPSDSTQPKVTDTTQTLLFLLALGLGEAFDDGHVFERGSVTLYSTRHTAFLRDLAQQAAHDLTAAGFRQ